MLFPLPLWHLMNSYFKILSVNSFCTGSNHWTKNIEIRFEVPWESTPIRPALPTICLYERISIGWLRNDGERIITLRAGKLTPEDSVDVATSTFKVPLRKFPSMMFLSSSVKPGRGHDYRKNCVNRWLMQTFIFPILDHIHTIRSYLFHFSYGMNSHYWLERDWLETEVK